MTRDISEVDLSDLIGVPYKERGRDISGGLDCYGLAIEVQRRLGKDLADTVYDETHDAALCTEERTLLMGLKSTERLEFGNIVTFSEGGRLHMGVMINGTEFIHATYRGVRVSPIKAYEIREIYEWA